MKLFDLTDRKALVVGGTSGLGKAIALGLAEAGADTAVTGRRIDAVREVNDQIRALGRQSFDAACDATNRDQLSALRQRGEAEFGGLDILVYAAGVTLKKPTVDLTGDDWHAVTSINLDGALFALQTFHPLLAQSRYPRVITIASLSSLVAFHQVAAYSASKAALLSLTRSLACEWAESGIRVNAIVPGVFVTDLNRKLLFETPRGQELLTRTPMKRFGDASELVGAAIYLASDAASFVTGTALAVDGGFLASGVNQ